MSVSQGPCSNSLQDMALVSAEELLVGAIWSDRLGSHRPLADGLHEVMQHVLIQQT